MNLFHFKTCAVWALVCFGAVVASAAEPVFKHSFASATDDSGLYAGKLCNGASLKKLNDVPVLDLGASNGYFDFGTDAGNVIKSLTGDYSFATVVFIPSETNITANGNFVFSFSKSSSTGYLFFGSKESRYSITPTDWNKEQTVSAAMAFPKGEWVNLAVVQKGDQATVYLNGEAKKTSKITMKPSELGATPQNWLGRSPYSGDAYLKNARYADFRIYNAALSAAEVKDLVTSGPADKLNAEIYKAQLDEALASLNYDFSAVRSDLSLPATAGGGVALSWKSSDPALITDSGRVTRPAQGKPDGKLKLTVTASKGGMTATKEFDATVIALTDDRTAAEYDLDVIAPRSNVNNLRSSLVLPASTPEGSIITWKSSDESYITSTGRLLRQSPKGQGKHEVTMTATAHRGELKVERSYKVYVAEDEDYDSYLFVYFPSNSNENLYYALSTDGYKYTPLNNGEKILDSKTYARKKGIRDPHILRGEDGKTFYMVATDMKSAEGWSSNRGIVMYRSTDLVNWETHTVHFPDRFPEWKNVTRVWAPEVIWDPDYANTDGSKGRYMVYFSLLTNDGKCPYDKIYYCYANDDFSDLMTDPVFFYDRGSATIDGDIIYDERDGLYHMVYKNEGSGGICQVTATRLTAEPGKPAGSQWSSPSAPLQQTDKAVEGAGMFRLINSDTWILMYDCYNNGFYQFCSSDDLQNFTLRAQTTTSGAFTPRHGTVMPLHPEETARLLEKFPPSVNALERKVTGSASKSVRTDLMRITSSAVQMPVILGTDLSSFDPELTVSPGATVTPAGAQDFTQGPVTYTISSDGSTTEVKVEAYVAVNPVLPGFNADPEVMYSNKTGRFYIYPTTDGISGWGGYNFAAWSSSDLVNWQRENVILDLKTDDVTWADGNAWAPCIEEKYENGKYRYYFYFSGNNPSMGRKTLGCAVSDSPTGPFTDAGRSIIDTNITGGQLIDSDIFTDPVSGNTYYYWGNGQLVASKMNADMMSVTDATVITPQGGSLSDYAFREGVYVFYRQGKYYFMWSVDDTGARNYHVAYGTSDSPMGPITVAAEPVVLIQDADNAIYGTGHNSVLQMPGRDEWYIVYHRINRSYVNNGPGYHREVCIDRLEFNADGTIKPVKPTHRGINPVDVTYRFTGVEDVVADGFGTDSLTVATTWYDINGRNLGADKPGRRGIYIRADRKADGSMRTSKVAL